MNNVIRASREVNSQERISDVGYRVDIAGDQISAIGWQLFVCALEGEYLVLAGNPERMGNPVCMCPGCIDAPVEAYPSPLCLNLSLVYRGFEGGFVEDGDLP